MADEILIRKTVIEVVQVIPLVEEEQTQNRKGLHHADFQDDTLDAKRKDREETHPSGSMVETLQDRYVSGGVSAEALGGSNEEQSSQNKHSQQSASQESRGESQEETSGETKEYVEAKSLLKESFSGIFETTKEKATGLLDTVKEKLASDSTVAETVEEGSQKVKEGAGEMKDKLSSEK